MNGLSWMLYWAGVVDGLNGTATLAVIAAIVAAVIFAIVALILKTSAYGEDDIDHVRAKSLATTSGRLLAAAIGVALVSSFIPTKSTMYAIAASEMGEQVLKSQTATKAVKALDAWLDRQIAEPAK